MERVGFCDISLLEVISRISGDEALIHFNGITNSISPNSDQSREKCFLDASVKEFYRVCFYLLSYYGKS